MFRFIFCFFVHCWLASQSMNSLFRMIRHIEQQQHRQHGTNHNNNDAINKRAKTAAKPTMNTTNELKTNKFTKWTAQIAHFFRVLFVGPNSCHFHMNMKEIFVCAHEIPLLLKFMHIPTLYSSSVPSHYSLYRQNTKANRPNMRSIRQAHVCQTKQAHWTQFLFSLWTKNVKKNLSKSQMIL